jgi:parallel beta-helix repeat protein
VSSKKSFLILLVSVLFTARINADVIVYSEGFETTNGNYTHTGTLDRWEWGTPAASFAAGPMAAHSGTKCWGTDLDNYVSLNSDTYLTSPAIAIPALAAGEIARVRFYAWISVDTMYDRGEFQVSSNGSVWETKAELFYKMLGGWTEYYFDVSSYAGGNIYLRFRCYSDGSNAGAGLYKDDVAVSIAEAPLVRTTVTLEAWEDQAAYASCPWVYTWNGTEYVKDNDIYSTARGPQNEYVDYYNISKPLEALDGSYYLQLRETEYEESYTDMAQLVTVDHSPEISVASDDKGNILTYSNPAAPVSAVDDEGADVTALVANQDDAGFNGYNDNYLILDFGNPDISNGATLVLRVHGFQVDGDGGNPTFAQPCIRVQTQDDAGNWVTTNEFYPRWNWSTSAYDLSGNLANSKLIRLYVTSCHYGKYHVIDYVGLDTSAQVPVTTNVLSAASAVHSVEGDVTAAISSSDNDYAHMATAESITLKFPAPARTGQARSFVLITEGYYKPMGTYFIYTWDGNQWAQRDGWTVEGSGDRTHEFDLSSWLPDPNGEWKVRIWQDYWYESAGIDFVGASRGGVPGIMTLAYDLKKSLNVTSMLNTSDNIRDDWGSSIYSRDRWVEIIWEPFIINTPPTVNPVTITNETSDTPAINWTYNDTDADPQVQYEVEVWTGPDGTGSNMWDPAIGSGTAGSIVYAGSPLVVETTYYARVKAFDGYSWGAWSETSWIFPLSALEIIKIDDINDDDCVVPDREINYTITYNYRGAGDTNVTIIDYLPVAIDYNSSSPGGDYNAISKTVTWNIGTVPPDGSGTLTVKGFVNYRAEPCGVFTNSCRIEGDSMTDEVAEVNTPVCYWNQIIYVDHNAAGLNNGLTWEDAYLYLQDALNRAAAEGHSEIWVAAGTYGPSVLYQNYPTFRLIDGAPVYGHFAGNETSISQRDFNDANNETILTRVGAIWPQYVVTASGFSRNNIIDGFTLKECTYASVRVETARLAISNCIIIGTSENGINAINSAFKVNDCIIQNKSIGIYDSNSIFEIDNCVIQNNNSGGISVDFVSNGTLYGSRISNCLIQNNTTGYGIYLTGVPLSSSITITGCNTFGNGLGIYTQNGSCASICDNLIYKNSSVGIYLRNPGLTTIRNNTIVGHTSYGIRWMDAGTAPVINNCIVWGNNDDLYSCSATYSCIDDNDAGTGNIHTDPCFVDANSNNFHLRPESLCIDAGDPNFRDFNGTDIDGECRIMFGKTALRVDIGEDELYWLKADFDRNEIVNFIDYAIWAPAWQAVDQNKSLDMDSIVDINDLVLFCDYWLWEGPWSE